MNLQDRTTAALAWIDAQLALCNAATEIILDDGDAWDSEGVSIVSSYNDETSVFIAAARTGYPAILEEMKAAIEEFQWQSSDNRIGETGKIRAQQALDSILTKIESLQ